MSFEVAKPTSGAAGFSSVIFLFNCQSPGFWKCTVALAVKHLRFNYLMLEVLCVGRITLKVDQKNIEQCTSIFHAYIT